MANKPVLDLEVPDTAGTQPHYNNRLELDRVVGSAMGDIDAWAGAVTGSFTSVFYCSGTIDTHLGGHLGQSAQPYGGVFWAREPRVITEVKIVAAYSGSGGVTRVDVKTQENTTVAPTTIFSNNIFKPILSASAGAWTQTNTKTFATSSWKKDCALVCTVDSAANVMSDVAVIVCWRPSASYGAGV